MWEFHDGDADDESDCQGEHHDVQVKKSKVVQTLNRAECTLCFIRCILIYSWEIGKGGEWGWSGDHMIRALWIRVSPHFETPAPRDLICNQVSWRAFARRLKHLSSLVLAQWLGWWLGIPDSWVQAPLATELIHQGVDSACHPSEVGKMSTSSSVCTGRGALHQRHSRASRNDSYPRS